MINSSRWLIRHCWTAKIDHQAELDRFSIVYTGIGVCNKECVNRTLMTRMRRIIADFAPGVEVNDHREIIHLNDFFVNSLAL
jgi:hypothetical protein